MPRGEESPPKRLTPKQQRALEKRERLIEAFPRILESVRGGKSAFYAAIDEGLAGMSVYYYVNQRPEEKERLKAAEAEGRDPRAQHGTRIGYVDQRCRCWECRDAWSAYYPQSLTVPPVERGNRDRRKRTQEKVGPLFEGIVSDIASGTPTPEACKKAGIRTRELFFYCAYREGAEEQVIEAEAKTRQSGPHGRGNKSRCGWCWECRECDRVKQREWRQRKKGKGDDSSEGRPTVPRTGGEETDPR